MQTTARTHSDPTPPAEHPNRRARRISLSREVHVQLADSEGFVPGRAENVSATGMFVRCRTPRPPGAVVGFEFSLADGSPLIRGRGEVMWVRHRDAGSHLPAGMGIQFLDLSEQSRQLIAWTVERRTRQQRRHLEKAEAERTHHPPPGPSEMEDLCREVEDALGEIPDLEGRLRSCCAPPSSPTLTASCAPGF